MENDDFTPKESTFLFLFKFFNDNDYFIKLYK